MNYALLPLCGLLFAVASACGAESSPQERELGLGGSNAVGGHADTVPVGGTSTSANSGGSAGSMSPVESGGSAESHGGTSGGPGGSAGIGSTAGGMSANGGSSTSGGVGAGGSAGAANAAGSGGNSGGRVCTGKPASSVTVYMIGDSTMSVYASDLYPRMGWGQSLGGLFSSDCATVVDKALSGRSSKSFFEEHAWTPIKDALKAGDYVLIQFGHNDEKSAEPTLFTDPQTTYKQFLTTYVNDTRAKKATPILLTSINRNNWNGTKLSDTHGAYPPAVRELAGSLKVDLIDLTALTKTYFERIGQAETSKLFLILKAGQSPNYPNGVTDNTHLQELGAKTIDQLAMADAYAQNLSLASLLKAVPAAP